MTDATPDIQRVRHELRRRQLKVARVERVAPMMLRVVLEGEELRGFTSLGFDDHIKLFFAQADADAPAMRDFTPRHYDPDKGELWVDFFLHEAGPAATWASQVAPGQTLTIGGPRGSFIISPQGIDTHVLIGDETALPAIGRRLEELPANTRALVLTETDGGATGYPLQSKASLQVLQVQRNSGAGSPGHETITRLRTLELPTGASFIWVACESQAARTIRRYLTDERGVDKRWIKAAGYWQRGAVGTHDSINDEG